MLSSLKNIYDFSFAAFDPKPSETRLKLSENFVGGKFSLVKKNLFLTSRKDERNRC